MKLSIQQLMRLKQTEPDSERFFAYFDKCTSMLIEQIDTLSVIATAFGDYAKSKMQIERQEVDVIKTIQSVVDLYANNEEKVQIVLSDERPNELQQPFVVNAEGKGMTQVFSNLIKNAIQAKQKNQEGKILISIFCENEKFIVKIKDNGVGMNAQQLERIFEPNFTTKTSGMGLGLPIVRNILQQIGATISVSSSEGVGTEFVLEF
jgi:signal transduction histidine kinase